MEWQKYRFRGVEFRGNKVLQLLYSGLSGVIKAVSGPASYIAQTSWLKDHAPFCFLLFFFFIWLPIC